MLSKCQLQSQFVWNRNFCTVSLRQLQSGRGSQPEFEQIVVTRRENITQRQLKIRIGIGGEMVDAFMLVPDGEEAPIEGNTSEEDIQKPRIMRNPRQPTQSQATSGSMDTA